MTTDRKDELTSCRYRNARRGECGCQTCDVDGCDECIAHLRPMIDGKRYCYSHAMFGTSTTAPKGFLDHV